ncbi:DNA polymerase delta, subunit 4-domain-containing protein [Triangularia setosa]|uniref:DNA polymerase delta, subunit 4-domain-containing protein n=1 Tax=Triangularia setosa TaxID=2587417 RepID=A0AAN6WCR7_9PEZI|nr:DNA polymerase delta, subunit 4-domain-containing protein [Podospora setosa]
MRGLSALKSCKQPIQHITILRTHTTSATFSPTYSSQDLFFYGHSDKQSSSHFPVPSLNSLTPITADVTHRPLSFSPSPCPQSPLTFTTPTNNQPDKAAVMPVTRRSTRVTSSRASSSSANNQSKLNFSNKITKPLPSRTNSKDKAAKVEEAIIRTTATPEPVPDKVKEQQEAVTKLSPSEVKASKVSQAAINRYWKGIEDSRLAKEVHKKHTSGLSTGEKVLRYWDVSSQFGPCVGITRLKRWQRAERLGLNPPVEVLAVIVKEGRGEERAHLDELLNSAAVGERE